MGLIHLPVRAGAVAVLGLAITALTGAFASSAAVAAASSGVPRFVTLGGSLTPTTDHVTGAYSSSRMSVEVALAPRNPAALISMLRGLYTRDSGTYHHWLANGQFDARFSPAAAARAAVDRYLTASGLRVQRASSPFLVLATGSSQRVSAAFRTVLSTYRDPRGVRYFSNSAAVQLPAALAPEVLGVVGLSDTVREHSMIARAQHVRRPAGKPSGSSPGCETPYVTREQLFNEVNNGVVFPYGYGGGPGCSGLTPSQTNSIYGAPDAGPRGKGAGVSLAVFELSAYTQSDITTWAHTFYGPQYAPPLVNINVDGGPLTTACPSGDTCVPGYGGDIEVNADIEMQLTIAPDARHILVYDAPNDYTGQTSLDEYAKIANDDSASVVSSSWGVCENDVSAAYVQAENVIFEQMASQGQSMFASAGDDGAFDCLGSDGTTIVNVDDPEAQPWVTSVGGTSLESDNPGTSPEPAYPAGVESVWNVDNLCSSLPASPALGGQTGFFWCAATGAGGGGSSQYWGRPSYQRGPGVTSRYTSYGNGTTQCSLAAAGTPCREVPDISANADQYTPYAEYCTGTDPTSACGSFSGSLTPPGWFGVGGTSLSSPLWSGVIADRDSFQGQRSGNINPLLYLLYNLDPHLYFHDITGIGQSTSNNGLFPTTPGYDEATGIGTPKMAALITGS